MTKFKQLYPGALLTFPYTNHKGEYGIRTATFAGIEYGSNEWYPDPQWFIRTWDLDKNAARSFALNLIDPTQLIIKS